jgi:tetratricopeptide (TPR) repeat protein
MPGEPDRARQSLSAPDHKGVELRPGAVAAARAESGLSLARLGAPHLTRAAVHRIEKGLSRPSLRSLTLIAERTAKPLSFFLPTALSRPQAPAEQLERFVVEARFEEALAIGEKVLQDGGLPGHVVAAVRYWLAEAHVRLNQPEAALSLLAHAIPALGEHGDPWMVVHALHMKSSALYLMDDPESQFVAEAALRLCRELEPSPPMLEARILNHLAAIAVHQQQWQQAIHIYERALAAAEPLRNLRQLSLLYEGMGIACGNLGRPVQARDYFSRSLALYGLQSDLSSMARAEVNLSELLRLEGQFATAEEHIQRSLRYCDEHGVDRRNRSYATVGLAKLRFDQGREGEAEELAEVAGRLAEERGEMLSLATALQLLGRLRLRQHRDDEGDACYARAVDLYRTINLGDRVKSAHIEYAEELDERGRSAEARDQWRMAALADRRSPNRAAAFGTGS